MNDTTQTQFTRPVTATPLLVIGGAVIASMGTLAPWARVASPFGTQTTGPQGGGVALLLLLLIVAGVVGSKWSGRLPVARRIGLGVTAAALAFFAVAGFASAGDAAQRASQASGPYDIGGYVVGPTTSLVSVSIGIGLYLYTIGLLAISAGLFRSCCLDRDAVAERPASSALALVA